MTTILDTFCDICTRLQPLAIMALVPMLLWIHHFETHSPADHVADTDKMVDDLGAGDPIVLLRDATEKGVTTADTLESRWAA